MLVSTVVTNQGLPVKLFKISYKQDLDYSTRLVRKVSYLFHLKHLNGHPSKKKTKPRDLGGFQQQSYHYPECILVHITLALDVNKLVRNCYFLFYSNLFFSASFVDLCFSSLAGLMSEMSTICMPIWQIKKYTIVL